MADPETGSVAEQRSWLDRVNREFQAQRAQYNFRYLCQDCCYLGEHDVCIQGFPNEMLLSADTEVVLKRGQWTFCKYFELD